MQNPELVWEWYHWRQSIILKAAPNAAHYAFVELEKRFSKFLLLTQNVDNLHHRAGSKNVLELHGNIFRTRCLSCGSVRAHAIDSDTKVENVPRCSCGGLLRPDVVWFGESIPQDVWQQSIAFLSQADGALVSGTSGVVWPAAAIPELAKRGGAKTIEINLEATPVTPIVDVSIQGRAGEILPQIVQKL